MRFKKIIKNSLKIDDFLTFLFPDFSPIIENFRTSSNAGSISTRKKAKKRQIAVTRGLRRKKAKKRQNVIKHWKIQKILHLHYLFWEIFEEKRQKRQAAVSRGEKSKQLVLKCSPIYITYSGKLWQKSQTTANCRFSGGKSNKSRLKCSPLILPITEIQ